MDRAEAEGARRWLAAQGVTQDDDGRWTVADSPVGPLTANEVAHEWADVALADPALDPAARLRLGFGLLDLLGEYWVTHEIASALEDERDPLPADPFWDGYRRRLEGREEPAAVTYSLWVDWFEDRGTAERAFAEVWGPDVTARGGTAADPLLRRARRVLEVSGPVPWPLKQAAYETAATVPALHSAVFRGVLGSYHDVYGDLEPVAALALLRRLELPAGTEHLAALHAVLEAGHRNNHLAPEAWPRATADR